MDEKTKQAEETSLVLPLLRNETVITHPKFGDVRIKRPTPEQEGQIADVRRKRYHSDLFDDADPKRSRDEIRDRAISKGMWRLEYEDQIKDLTQRLGEAMGILDAIGFKSLTDLINKFQSNVAALLSLFPENEDVRGVIRAYYNLDAQPKAEDRAKIVADAVSTQVDDLLDEGDTIRTQIDLLKELTSTRKQLDTLRMKEVKLFVDSLESRADREEELARIYYCMADAKTGKPLWSSYDEMRRANGEDIESLTFEMAYFVNGVTPAFKEIMGRFGFIQRLTDTSDSSDDSLVQPVSSSAGESVESAPTVSSEVTA